jgi:hypothetical protein
LSILERGFEATDHARARFTRSHHEDSGRFPEPILGRHSLLDKYIGTNGCHGRPPDGQSMLTAKFLSSHGSNSGRV